MPLVNGDLSPPKRALFNEGTTQCCWISPGSMRLPNQHDRACVSQKSFEIRYLRLGRRPCCAAGRASINVELAGAAGARARCDLVPFALKPAHPVGNPSTPEHIPALVAPKLELLPTKPGCYLFLDADQTVVYVGKAKSLRSRVRSYFQEGTSDSRYFIPLLRKVVRDVETILTATEKEAAVLENQLIKQHRPRFNVKLRDDKDFLCIRLDLQKEWPMLETVRRPEPDGARYFGPYHSATSARRTLHLVNKHFQLRTCSDAEFAMRKRPCLQYQIKRCPAPCVLEVDKAYYAEMVRSVSLFLEGRHDELSGELSARMKDAARAMEYEKAAIYRDQLKAIEMAAERQRVVSVKDVDQDVIGLYREGSVVELELLEVRKGRVTDSFSFSLRQMEMPDEEVLSGFLSAYYGDPAQAAVLPNEIVLPILPDGADGIGEWLSELRGRKVELLVPQRGARAALLKMARENAWHVFQEKQRSGDDIEARLAELRDKLRLKTLPVRIECCDISHLGGGDVVGSIVALKNGLPDKKHYRSFHVKHAAAAGIGMGAPGDDYAAMYEVLSRRFRRAKLSAEAQGKILQQSDGVYAPPAPPKPLVVREKIDRTYGPPREAGEELPEIPAEFEVKETGAAHEGDWDLPDLLVVDGGRGQLNVALSAARDLGLHGLMIVGLAKERESAKGETMVDRVYLPGQKNGIPLKGSSSALFFLAKARDEAHRFANHVRKKLGKARRLHSEIDDVRGLSREIKRALLRHLGSMAGLRAATDTQILAVPGVTKRHLSALRKAIPAPENTQGGNENL